MHIKRQALYLSAVLLSLFSCSSEPTSTDENPILDLLPPMVESISLVTPDKICDGIAVRFTKDMILSSIQGMAFVSASNDTRSSLWYWNQSFDVALAPGSGSSAQDFRLNFKTGSICDQIPADFRITAADVHVQDGKSSNGISLASDPDHPLEKNLSTEWWIIPGVPLDPNLASPTSASASVFTKLFSSTYVRVAWDYPQDQISSIDKFTIFLPDRAGHYIVLLSPFGPNPYHADDGPLSSGSYQYDVRACASTGCSPAAHLAATVP